jgi:hypothetical protein
MMRSAVLLSASLLCWTHQASAADCKSELAAVHEVVADQQTKRPLRYRARTSMKGSPYSATDRSFEFISTLAIEAP